MDIQKADPIIIQNHKRFPYDFVITLDSGEQLFIEAKLNSARNNISSQEFLALIASKLQVVSSQKTDSRCLIGYSCDDKAVILGYNDKFLEIASTYEYVLCKMLFADPQKSITEAEIFNAFRAARQTKGDDVYIGKADSQVPEQDRQVETAARRINDKAEKSLGLKKIFVRNHGLIRINSDYLTA